MHSFAPSVANRYSSGRASFWRTEYFVLASSLSLCRISISLQAPAEAVWMASRALKAAVRYPFESVWYFWCFVCSRETGAGLFAKTRYSLLPTPLDVFSTLDVLSPHSTTPHHSPLHRTPPPPLHHIRLSPPPYSTPPLHVKPHTLYPPCFHH